MPPRIAGPIRGTGPDPDTDAEAWDMTGHGDRGRP